MRRLLYSDRAGSVLIWTVLVMAILSLFATEVLRAVSGRFQLGEQASAWQEGLLAAESGVDLAIVELRKPLYPPPAGSPSPTPVTTLHFTTPIPAVGLAGTDMKTEVDIDNPAQLKDPSNGWQYYRIRTLGTRPLTGPPRSGFNKQDNRLRKLTLKSQRFIDGLFASETSTPHAARRVEAIVKPSSSFNQAILAVGKLDLNNLNIEVDSYDSRDTTKSTGGLYDPAKRQENGNIATDGQILEAGGAHVYGDVSTNSGTSTGVGNVTGEQRTDFYQDVIPIKSFTWPSINPTPSTVNGTTTLAAGPTKGAPSTRYVLSRISLNNQSLTLGGAANGSQTYIEVYVTGDISISGNNSSQITVAPGVSATIYFAGNIDIAGNGIVNTNNQPGDLLMYGIQPAAGVTPTVKLAGNSNVSAAIYAPDADVTIKGGGSGGSYFGSIVGKTVTMNGVTNLHYDEALSAGGLINNYQIVSWFEDTR